MQRTEGSVASGRGRDVVLRFGGMGMMQRDPDWYDGTLDLSGPEYAGSFDLGTAAKDSPWEEDWCALVSNRVLGGPIRRYGHIAMPLVLIARGLC